ARTGRGAVRLSKLTVKGCPGTIRIATSARVTLGLAAPAIPYTQRHFSLTMIIPVSDSVRRRASMGAMGYSGADTPTESFELFVIVRATTSRWQRSINLRSRL